MDLKEAVGVVQCYIDAKTGERLTHSEIYGRIIDFLGGLEVIERYIPFETDKLIEAYKRDENFNNLPLSEWDRQAEFLRFLYSRHGVTYSSISEGVCILKEAAKRVVENSIAAA